MPGNTYREMFEAQQAAVRNSLFGELSQAAEILAADQRRQVQLALRQGQSALAQGMAEVAGMQAEALGQQAAINRLFAPTQGQFGSLIPRTRSFTSRLVRSQVRREQFMKVEETGFAKWSKQIELETVC